MGTPYQAGGVQQTALDELLAKMIVKDIQPFSVVEDEGFNDFVKALNPRYKLPSRRTLVRTIIPRLLTTAKQDLRNLLLRTENIAITTDHWSSIS